jgi:hypothetical protein
MQKAILQFDGSTLKDAVDAYVKKGYHIVSMDEPLPASEMEDIKSTLDSITRRRVDDGSTQIIPRGRVGLSNGRNMLSINDFDVRENQSVRHDPVVIVYAERPGEILVAKEILEDDVIGVDIVTKGLISVFSPEFKTSVRDLARLLGEDENAVYNRCVNKLVSGSVSSFRYLPTCRVILPQNNFAQAQKWEDVYVG